MDIYAKLDSAEARYNDITAELSSGTLAGDTGKLTQLLKEQGENAFALAKEQYSLEIAVDKYMGIFERIVNQRN